METVEGNVTLFIVITVGVTCNCAHAEVRGSSGKSVLSCEHVFQGSDFGLQACIGGVFTQELPLGPQANVFNFILRNNQTDLVLYPKIFHTFYSLL